MKIFRLLSVVFAVGLIIVLFAPRIDFGEENKESVKDEVKKEKAKKEQPKEEKKSGPGYSEYVGVISADIP